MAIKIIFLLFLSHLSFLKSATYNPLSLQELAVQSIISSKEQIAFDKLPDPIRNLFLKEIKKKALRAFKKDPWYIPHLYLTQNLQHVLAEKTVIPPFFIQDFLDAEIEIEPSYIARVTLSLNNLLLTSLEGIEKILPPKDVSELSLMCLSGNCLVLQPSMFAQFSAMTTLYLNDSLTIKLIPGAFNGLGQLEYLYFSNNGLTELPPCTFQGLASLKLLDLGRNNLVTLTPDSFSGLAQLKTLLLSNNQLKVLEPYTFKNLNHLEELDCTENQLHTIKENAFFGLRSLSDLLLTSNKLQSLEKSTFNGLLNLRTLELSYNQLNQINVETFNTLRILQHLGLNSNRLSWLPKGLFLPLKNLRLIDLLGNTLLWDEEIVMKEIRRASPACRVDVFLFEKLYS